jgi:hypothetical protein
MTHPLLNSIFSETHKELQTLQQDFSCFQTHFVTIDSNVSELNLENNDEILDEVEAENSEFLVITETQLQKYQQLFKKTEIIEGDNLGDIEMQLLDKEIKRNNEECFKKNIIETSCCQNNCLKDKIDTERAFLRNSNFESLSKSNQDSFLMGYLVGSSGSQHVTVKGNKRVKAVCNYSFDAKEICLKAFKFVYGIGTTRWENIRTHFYIEDIKARVHKAIGKPSNRTISFSTIIKIVSFILSYANRWGLPSPGIYFNIILIIFYLHFYIFNFYLRTTFQT